PVERFVGLCFSSRHSSSLARLFMRLLLFTANLGLIDANPSVRPALYTCQDACNLPDFTKASNLARQHRAKRRRTCETCDCGDACTSINCNQSAAGYPT